HQDLMLQPDRLPSDVRPPGRRPLRGEGQRRMDIGAAGQDPQAGGARSRISRLCPVQVRRPAPSSLLRGRSTADLIAIYSITSSARASRLGWISRPSSLAVFMLMTSSNLVARSTGRSAGFAPLRILPT